MSILSSMYSSMTGLSTYSRALDAISNNVANLNTLGFKGDTLLFSDIKVSQSGRAPGVDSFQTQRGAGAIVIGQIQRFGQGEIRQTGAVTNLAVDGNGFFVLQDSRGETLYTRNGQFEFDPKGRLISQSTGAVVQALDDAGRLSDLDIETLRVSPPSASSSAKLTGNLSLGDNEHIIDDFDVIDSSGGTQTLTLTFTRDTESTDTRWALVVTDEDEQVLAEGELRFTPGGTPVDGFNTLTFAVTAPTGEVSEVMLDFGPAGELDGTTSFSGGPNSSVRVDEVDGYGPGQLSQVVFNERGEAVLTFSNGQTQTGPRVALAAFRDPQALQSLGGSLFVRPEGQPIQLGHAAEGPFGEIVPGSVELSNVDLAREFAEIIILQRGFQASSQVLTVANEMVEQVYNNLGG